MIIEWPLKWQFQDVMINILTSRTAISKVVENVVNIIYPFKMVKIPLFLEKIITSNGFMTQIMLGNVILTIANILSHKNR